MERIDLGAIELSFEVFGHGEPVVTIHSSAFASWYLPVVSLLPQFATLYYRRHVAKDRAMTISEDASL